MKQTKTATIVFNKPKSKTSNKALKGKDSIFVRNPKKYRKNVLDVPVWIRIVRVFKKDFRS